VEEQELGKHLAASAPSKKEYSARIAGSSLGLEEESHHSRENEVGNCAVASTMAKSVPPSGLCPRPPCLPNRMRRNVQMGI